MAKRNWRKRLSIGLLALIVLLIILWIYGNHKTHQAEKDYPAIGPFVDIDGTRLHYVTRGSGQPVVLIHGSDGLLQDYTLTILDSIAEFAQAIAFDRPGHGCSDRPANTPLTLELNARLIHDALDKLGLTRPVIVGHSYGGAVALQYALNYPDQTAALVLLAPGAYTDGLPVGERGAAFLMSLPNTPVIGPLITNCLVAPLFGFAVESGITPSFAPNPVTKEYAEILSALMPRPKQFRAWADESSHFAANLDSISPHYGTITCPTIIVAGDSDHVAAHDREALRLRGSMPNAELILLPKVGHMVHHASPGVVIDAVRRQVLVAQLIRR